MLIKGLRKQEPSLTAKRLPLTSDLLSLCIRSIRSGYLSAMPIRATNQIPQRKVRRKRNASTPQHPLFLTETGKMATRFWFQKHFHNVLLISGIRSEHYSSHSFRIGAASTAARLGISDQTIQVLGRWSSLAYLNDLRRAHAQLSSI
ncbi:hypothetical protein KUCAC02_025236 [Chaenocephalus aceratus]|nr:hypothetical protein KUCAC02_025236 [Chaenocephalus aceratus]